VQQLPSPPPAPPTDRKIAVVLSSSYGAEISDFVAPFEILGRSGAFEMFVLAPERKLLPLVNGNMADTSLDFVPHYAFAEYDSIVGRAPDVIAIPWVPGHTAERDAAMIEWIRNGTGPNTTLLTICAGTQILAETGLMRGHTATTNVGWYDKLEKGYPDVRWVRDVRYHDDGSIITSTNLTAGIDASLRAVDRLVGRSTALRVAREMGYRATHYLDDPRMAPVSTGALLAGLAPMVLNAALKWPQRELGVLLYDGVGELALGALMDLYGGSCAVRPHVVAPERQAIRSQHGLAVVPRHSAHTAPMLDRVVLPRGGAGAAAQRAAATWSAVRPERRVEDIHATLAGAANPERSVYDLTLRDLARMEGRGVARGIGKAVFYAFDDSVFDAGRA
jgi:AraC family transcriptional regulator, transcriptional activator FtrA